MPRPLTHCSHRRWPHRHCAAAVCGRSGRLAHRDHGPVPGPAGLCKEAVPGGAPLQDRPVALSGGHCAEHRVALHRGGARRGRQRPAGRGHARKGAGVHGRRELRGGRELRVPPLGPGVRHWRGKLPHEDPVHAPLHERDRRQVPLPLRESRAHATRQEHTSYPTSD